MNTWESYDEGGCCRSEFYFLDLMVNFKQTSTVGEHQVAIH